MNKTIDLCGIGNGLVDIQIEVDEKFIEQFSLNKGEMRLIDSENQQKIIEILKDFKIHKSSGGSAANTIITFAKFGGNAAYITSLGDDELGEFYSNEFKELNIELSAQKLYQQFTGTCLILITPDSERTMLTALGASAYLKPENIEERLIKNSKWIYIEGYEFTQKNSRDAIFTAIDMAKYYHTQISLTFSDVFIVENFRKDIIEATNKADLIFCNEKEAMKFSQIDDLNKVINFFELNTNNFVITKGKDGSIVKWQQNYYNIKAYPAIAKDTTGAGDTFAGAFLYGLIHKNSPILAGNLASYTSAKVVEQLGARLNYNFNIIKNKIFVDNYE